MTFKKYELIEPDHKQSPQSPCFLYVYPIVSKSAYEYYYMVAC